MCQKNDYVALWSNEAIEFWFLLYFNLYDCSMNRSEYEKKLNKEFKKNNIDLMYLKNNSKVFENIITKGSLKTARKNALKIHKNFINRKYSSSKSNSCTLIYKFFDEIDERNESLSLKKCEAIFK